MSQLAVLPRLLGNLMYEYPDTERNQIILSQLDQLALLFPWKDQAVANQLIQQLVNQQAQLDNYAFSVLFEGQGEMVAPPWGSVYQTIDNTVMGDSMDSFRRFLQHIGMDIELNNEPCDHFAIMLWAIASVLENEQDDELVELLDTHLLPWGYRYLELLTANTVSPFYATLAQLCQQFLVQLETELEITPKMVPLYR